MQLYAAFTKGDNTMIVGGESECGKLSDIKDVSKHALVIYFIHCLPLLSHDICMKHTHMHAYYHLPFFQPVPLIYMIYDISMFLQDRWLAFQ